MIVLSREPGGLSLYQQLYRQLRGQIARGEIQAGQKLPAKRAMAQQLNISVNTVDGAYRQLESEGYIAARPRSGFYVCQIEALAPHSTAPVPTAAAPVQVRAGGGGFLPRWNRGGEIPAAALAAAPARLRGGAADPQPHPRRWGPGPAQRDLPVYF